jgi:CrcB protein
MVGLLGGFTTFSAYSLEAEELIRNHQIGLSLFYIFASSGLGILLSYAGIRFVELVF